MSSVEDAALASAYAACSRLAREHYENFPVASRLLPRRMRPHIAAIYAFARIADDFADEGTAPPADRLRRLDAWGDCLARSLAGARGPLPARPGGARRPLDPRFGPTTAIDQRALFLALAHTIDACRLPVTLFEDLLSAFRQDVQTHRYRDWDELLDYCRRSANPVGRLVLRVAGHDDPRLDRAADCLCTALQLTNFWQDLERDYAAGRIYVPADDRDACGALEADLAARRWSPGWREVMERVAARTRDLFDAGRAACDGVAGRFRLELRLTWLGGRRILDRLERNRFDVLTARPALGLRDGLFMLWKALTW